MFCKLEVNQSFVCSVSQSVSQSISQSVNQSISQSINQSINQSVCQSVNQSINQSVRQSAIGAGDIFFLVAIHCCSSLCLCACFWNFFPEFCTFMFVFFIHNFQLTLNLSDWVYCEDLTFADKHLKLSWNLSSETKKLSFTIVRSQWRNILYLM